MIRLDPPLPLVTPIGDAECHLFDPAGRDDASRFLCSINATGEFWWFTQIEVRRQTNLTEGRSSVTPFSSDVIKRFAPMRKIADARE